MSKHSVGTPLTLVEPPRKPMSAIWCCPQANLVLVGRAFGLELFHEKHHAVLRLGDGEIAELHAGTRNAALAEIRGLVGKAVGGEVGLQRGEIYFRDIEQEQVLLVRRGNTVEARLGIFLR